MKLNFEAPVRLTEVLLPLLRRAAQTRSDGGVTAIVNVASIASRVSRPGAGAYSASKFALAGWSEALWAEERGHGVHVGQVFPGFVATEGFPARELLESRLTRWIVSTPELVADAVLDAGPGGKAERYVPRPYWLAPAARLLAPALVRRAVGGGAFTTAARGGGERPN
jgi:short-subunit dehydrogenase